MPMYTQTENVKVRTLSDYRTLEKFLINKSNIYKIKRNRRFNLKDRFKEV